MKNNDPGNFGNAITELPSLVETIPSDERVQCPRTLRTSGPRTLRASNETRSKGSHAR